MKSFGGKTLFLDRDDINTDEIIPAKYLTEITKEALKPYLLEDLKLDNFDPKTDLKDIECIITRANFGCGSSREHAPWALEMNGIHVVIAENFARIFRQSYFNCGMLAIELDKDTIEKLFTKFAGHDTTMEVNLEEHQLILKSKNEREELSFELGEFEKALVTSGGWVEFADQKYRTIKNPVSTETGFFI